ncbi:MAG: 1-acyl-sn-glycerol-3-phosphate acyltransferase [Chitinophagaceae bacterium]|nr:1-acyl-sn-glycerol-3-phosphate acyltransferase [Chitinophagaceae bacterium]
MEKIFLAIFNYFEKRRSVLYIFLLTCFLISGFFASRIQLEEDISKILPDDRKIQKLNEVFQDSKFLDKLVITISAKDTTNTISPDSLVAFADALVSKLNENLKPYINSIQDKIDDGLALEMFGSIHEDLPVYLDEKDYYAIDSLTRRETIRQTLQNNIRTLSSPAGVAFKSIIVKDPTGISLLAIKKLQQLQYDENFELYDNYVITKDQRHLMLFVTPAYPPNNTGKNAVFLKQIDKMIDSLQNTHQKAKASYFGASAVSAGNAAQLRKDSFLTQGITIFFLVVFIGLYFRRKSAPFLVLVPVIFGCLFSLALIYLIQGTISVIALATGSVVLGIAINYSLHVFNHFRHTGSIKEVINDLSTPMTIGSFTTIGGFICLQFVQSEMLKDLGLFAACSLIGASLCSLVFLPHLINTSKEKRTEPAYKHSFLDRIATYRLERNKYIVLTILLLTLIFAYTSRNVRFESDMMRMNYTSAALQQAEKELNDINAYALQSIYLVSSGKNLNDALINNEKAIRTVEVLRQKNIVTKYSGVSSLIISDSLQKIRIEKWRTYWTPQKKQDVLTALRQEGIMLKYNPGAFEGFRNLIDTVYTPGETEATRKIRFVFLNDFITEKEDKATVVTMLKVDRNNKQLVYEAFDANSDVTVVDKQYLAGRLVEIVKLDFASIAIMSAVLVFTVLLISFGRIELALVSFIPMFITWIWILGIMGLFGIPFNIVNIIISTLIFGLGDDYSLFIMDGLLKEYKTGKKNLDSYKSSIFLSAITTLVGLGVLIFAKHPALQSIALIAIIGITCVVLMSQILIPFFFHILIKNRTQKKRFPWTFSGLLKSVFAFSYFMAGCILLTVAGLIVIKFNPFNKSAGKLIYHTMLSKFAWSLMYIMGNVKKQIFNPLNEQFNTPAVIVANHQSFLDILVMIMLHPKLVLLTNKWVWNSPVFGFVVRMADYYPVMQGAEPSIDALEVKVKQGFSIVVFPEGTRSPEGNMKRFHKGAFFLAEKMQLDILPIVIHGTGYTMTKNDFLLKDGTVSLRFLPRIKPTETQWGETYAERAKKIGRYFREEFKTLKKQIETPDYFREQLVYNYIYKGPVLEWYMKIKIRLEKQYRVFNELVPEQGKVLDIGCGYGFMSYMLHFISGQRVITGIDYDEQKIATASHCFSKDENIQFTFADVMQYPFEQYDSIIMSDILHYLGPEQQRQVIEKSIGHLLPGGNIIIREGNSDLERRHKGTKLSELFSTRLLGFNKTSGNGLSFLSGNLIKEIANDQQLACVELDNTKFTSNIIFVLKKHL